MAIVSFAADIKPLFRPVDVDHMTRAGIKLDDFQHMSDPTDNYKHAQDVYDALAPRNGQPPAMPPGGPYWTQAQLALFAKWRSDGYRP